MTSQQKMVLQHIVNDVRGDIWRLMGPQNKRVRQVFLQSLLMLDKPPAAAICGVIALEDTIYKMAGSPAYTCLANRRDILTTWMRETITAESRDGETIEAHGLDLAGALYVSTFSKQLNATVDYYRGSAVIHNLDECGALALPGVPCSLQLSLGV